MKNEKILKIFSPEIAEEEKKKNFDVFGRNYIDFFANSFRLSSILFAFRR